MASVDTTAGTNTPPDPFSCEITEEDGHVRLTARGELDIAANPELERCCKEALERGTPVRLDLEAVSFIDSMGLRSLVGMLHESSDANRPRIVAASTPVERILQLTRTSKLFGL